MQQLMKMQICPRLGDQVKIRAMVSAGFANAVDVAKDDCTKDPHWQINRN
jgi:hypothetical protein